jgi:hypothetical protein
MKRKRTLHGSPRRRWCTFCSPLHHGAIARPLTTFSFRESAPDILSEYFEKIGSRETIGAKRKRGRPSKNTGTDTSEKLPNAKRQKLKSEPVIEKVKIVWNKGEAPAPAGGKEDQNGTGKGDSEKTIPKTPAPRKGRGGPPKSKALETSQESHGPLKNVPVIVAAKSETPSPDEPLKAKENKPMIKAEREEKIERLKKPKGQFERQGSTSDYDDAPVGGIAPSSSNDVTKKSQGRPPKAQGQASTSVDEVLPGKDIPKKEHGRPPKTRGQISSQEKLIPLEESSAKIGRGRPPKSKEPNVNEAHEGLKGGITKKGRGRPPKNGGSTPSSGAKNTPDIPVKRVRGRPSKFTEPRNIERESEENHDNRESSALG